MRGPSLGFAQNFISLMDVQSITSMNRPVYEPAIAAKRLAKDKRARGDIRCGVHDKRHLASDGTNWRCRAVAEDERHREGQGTPILS